LAAAGPGTDHAGAGGEAGDNAAPFLLSEGGAEGTDNGLWVETIISAKVNEALISQLPYLPDSTVNEVAGKCREGGSPAAATAASTPTGREGELPFTLQVRGRARRCLTA
jgi:hypothetical protein